MQACPGGGVLSLPLLRWCLAENYQRNQTGNTVLALFNVKRLVKLSSAIYNLLPYIKACKHAALLLLDGVTGVCHLRVGLWVDVCTAQCWTCRPLG